ncbi:hypothetical protein HYW60_00365 [Candidatus Kaiserbacteria bacterium]|nr:hypothetical protein [Candidatus Kaiserbacteria bacterium]
MGLRVVPLLGWGIAIYAVMFLLASIFATYNFQGVTMRLVSLAVLLTTGIIAGHSLPVHSWRDILPYSLSWAIIAAVIDGVMLLPLTGWQVYANWSVWLGYALVVIAPLLAHYPRFNRFSLSPGV